MYQYVVGLLIIIIIGIFKYEMQYWNSYKQFNGDTPLPIIGNGHKYGVRPESILKSFVAMWERNGMTTFRARLGFIPYVVICEPENAEIVLKNNKELNKSNDYRFIKEWLGDGLLLSTGAKWFRQRKILTPTFHFKILDQFMNVYNKNGDILINSLSQNLDKVIDVYKFVTLCSLDIICETAMGTNINAQKDTESEYVQSIYKITKLSHKRMFSTLIRYDFFYRLTPYYYTERKAIKVIRDMSDTVIHARKIALKDKINEAKLGNGISPENEEQFQVKGKTAFLDLLLLSKTSDGEFLPDDVIEDEVHTFMFEGHETSSSCISFVMYCLANNVDAQQKAFEEQYSLFGKDLTKEVTMSDANDMNYLDRVIKETLRVYPSVPLIGRALQNELKLKDGRILPSGTHVVVSHLLMAWNPNYYPDPKKFDPDRFTPENTLKRNPFLYVPFSAGPRNCIGQKFAILEVKTIISKVLRNFVLSSAGDKYEVILTADIVLKSLNGMNMILKKRTYKI